MGRPSLQEQSVLLMVPDVSQLHPQPVTGSDTKEEVIREKNKQRLIFHFGPNGQYTSIIGYKKKM